VGLCWPCTLCCVCVLLRLARVMPALTAAAAVVLVAVGVVATAAAATTTATHDDYPLTADDAVEWESLGRAPADHRVSLTVLLRMRADGALIRAAADDLASPRSPRYAQWLTREAADALTAPSTTTPTTTINDNNKDDDDENVMARLRARGVECARVAVEALRCTATAADAARLVGAPVFALRHRPSGRVVARADPRAAALPAELADAITLIGGLSQLPRPSQTRLGRARPLVIAHGPNEASSSSSSPNSADFVVVPETLRRLYNVDSSDGIAASSQAAVELQGYPAYVQSDLDTFAANVGMLSFNISANHTIGPFNADPEAESELDVQYLGAVGLNNTNWYWTEPDWLLEFATALSGMPDDQVPRVLSISYAWYELQQCHISAVGPCKGHSDEAGSRLFVEAVNSLLAKAAARGITISTASGDSGAHGRSDSACLNPHTRPEFPAASPYVTAVGGTMLKDGQTGPTSTPICQSQLACAVNGTEIVSSNKQGSEITSGGGFSYVSPRPSWQAAAVEAYLKSGALLPKSNEYNSSGRGLPDVAALAHNYYIEISGQVGSVDGTSAATPVWSGLVANLNAWRLSLGKPVLGFMNPLIYELFALDPTIFNDITSGDNRCTETTCFCHTGFGATVGWDACTGVGTPNYEKIKAGIVQLGI
jgi:tripeptidyl-peptidase I